MILSMIFNIMKIKHEMHKFTCKKKLLFKKNSAAIIIKAIWPFLKPYQLYIAFVTSFQNKTTTKANNHETLHGLSTASGSMPMEINFVLSFRSVLILIENWNYNTAKIGPIKVCLHFAFCIQFQFQVFIHCTTTWVGQIHKYT